ncbi:hypothetical protein [Campylobacter corcagiensis]|uniref:Uncharacterized protein n=1 Tax=Campylobacter corcagiensis TaxID=1448857 RepID=A0A7M1LIW2_9BACT|nr:hypothetical protein [Campylobacter corcagiensis]QKF64012.1 hypothetical protein CCORG_0122 [Campylobacter corcagiensis]QOQ87786.1 hypothetical protein IMC76_02965 [Campylobacter corcagiensis]
MATNSIVILGLCIVIFIMLIVMYVKDKQTDRKLQRYDNIVTDNMNEIFALKKELETQRELIDSMVGIDFDDEIERQINQKLEPIVSMLKAMN